MFPSTNGQLLVHGSPYSPILIWLGGRDPGVDDQTGTGIEFVWLSRRVYAVYGIQEGGRRDLARLLGGRLAIAWSGKGGRSHRVGRRPIVARHAEDADSATVCVFLLFSHSAERLASPVGDLLMMLCWS